MIMESYENPKFDESIEERYPIKLWFLFEVQASQKDIAKTAMKKHINKIQQEEGVFIKKYLIENVEEIEPDENLKSKGIEKIYSVIAETIVHTKDFASALHLVMNYAPSSIEVLSPNEYKLSLKDMQESLNSIADFMHKLLSHGLGGVVLKM